MEALKEQHNSLLERALSFVTSLRELTILSHGMKVGKSLEVVV
jgi:hypothetical protein